MILLRALASPSASSMMSSSAFARSRLTPHRGTPSVSWRATRTRRGCSRRGPSTAVRRANLCDGQTGNHGLDVLRQGGPGVSGRARRLPPSFRLRREERSPASLLLSLSLSLSLYLAFRARALFTAGSMFTEIGNKLLIAAQLPVVATLS